LAQWTILLPSRRSSRSIRHSTSLGEREDSSPGVHLMRVNTPCAVRDTRGQEEPSRCTECTRQPPTEKRVVHTCSILGWHSGSGPGAVTCSADGIARWLLRRPDFVEVGCPVWMFPHLHGVALHSLYDRSLEGMQLLSLPLLSYRPYQTVAIP
jgi:hypothetical protein